MMMMLVEQTNLYSVQTTVNSIRANINENGTTYRDANDDEPHTVTKL